MELVAFVIAVAIAYQALKGYRLTKQKTLWYVHFSFAVLSVGLLIDSVAGFFGIVARTLRGTVAFTASGYSVYFFAQLLAYSILIYAYVSQTRTLNTSTSPAFLASLFGFATLQAAPSIVGRLLGFLVEYHPVSEIVLLFLVLYVAVQTGTNYSATKDRNAFLVFLAFLLLTLSHLLFILQILSPLLFVIGHLLQLSGFVSFLAMLMRVTRNQ
jgi:hypothetical protein